MGKTNKQGNKSALALTLSLRMLKEDILPQDKKESVSRRLMMPIEFIIKNESDVQADYAVLTVGVRKLLNLTHDFTNWRVLEDTKDWTVARYILAPGATSAWSPMPPGFIAFSGRFLVAMPAESSLAAMVGLVRLDHAGGMVTRGLYVDLSAQRQARLALADILPENPVSLFENMELKDLFTAGL